MRLADTIKIRAGGVGSGRKAGKLPQSASLFHSKVQELMRGLSSGGFDYRGTNAGNHLFVHPSGDAAVIKDNAGHDATMHVFPKSSK